MGKVQKFVEQKEKEKHISTQEYIDLLRWYAAESNKLNIEWSRSMSDLNEAFNEKIKELKEAAK